MGFEGVASEFSVGPVLHPPSATTNMITLFAVSEGGGEVSVHDVLW